MDATRGKERHLYSQSVDPSRAVDPCLKAGPHRTVRPSGDVCLGLGADVTQHPVRISGRGCLKVTFGSTVVAKVPSWKAENKKMHFVPESH